jgi:exopolyphosphatase/guanosine-5'-triphosphate,3'-diphosphate pyrophosphatase
VTVEQFVTRYRIDREHARRVADMAIALYRSAVPDAEADGVQRLEWAALLHEMGFSVSHTGFHKHGAYILQHADMPGFSSREQQDLALLVFGCRGGLAKLAGALEPDDMRARLLALRLAVLFHHARRPIDAPRLVLLIDGDGFRFRVPRRWLAAHPQTAHLLAKERDEWESLGYDWRER